MRDTKRFTLSLYSFTYRAESIFFVLSFFFTFVEWNQIDAEALKNASSRLRLVARIWCLLTLFECEHSPVRTAYSRSRAVCRGFRAGNVAAAGVITSASVCRFNPNTDCVCSAAANVSVGLPQLVTFRQGAGFERVRFWARLTAVEPGPNER